VTPTIRLLYLLQRKHDYAYEKTSCLLWACVCSSSFHVSSHWTDFHEILGDCYALAGYIVAAPLGFLKLVDNRTCETSRTLVSVSLASYNDVW